MALTDEQIIELRKIYEQIRQIKYSHAYAMLCLADTTKEERAFFASVGDINNGRPYAEEQAEVEHLLRLLDEGKPLHEAQYESSDRMVHICLSPEEKRIAESYAAAKGITLPDVFKKALFDQIEETMVSAFMGQYAAALDAGVDAVMEECADKEFPPEQDKRCQALIQQAFGAKVASANDGEDLQPATGKPIGLFLSGAEVVLLEDLLMLGLAASTDQQKGDTMDTLLTKVLLAHEDMLELRKQGKYSFYGKSNTDFLRRGIAALDAGEGVEHDIVQAQLVNEGLADIENDKTVDGESVRATMAENYGV